MDLTFCTIAAGVPVNPKLNVTFLGGDRSRVYRALQISRIVDREELAEQFKTRVTRCRDEELGEKLAQLRRLADAAVKARGVVMWT